MLFHLHGSTVSPKKVFPTPSSTVHNTRLAACGSTHYIQAVMSPNSSTEHHISCLHSHFWNQLSCGSPLPPPYKNGELLLFFHVQLFLCSYSDEISPCSIYKCLQNLYEWEAIFLTFDTRVRSTEVFRLIFRKNYLTTPPTINDPFPREFGFRS